MKLKDVSRLPVSLFKLLFVNFLFGNLFFMIILGGFSLIGLYPVNLNDEAVYGLKGFLVLVLFTPFTSLVFVSLFWVWLKVGNKIITKLF
ncbi:hypothetical protein [Algoriphagus sp. A40]|uniref:hypothetical protein n=1 Tax=Algoriphagus sp. A40 TaxID=1945863 RepID=UPI000985D85E|nr:hypothetical protein [Algoriphagus sp. A40]OOG76428.1 hypothetical protein B0E43_08025 [Algoriphagus sp. A40]